MAERQLTDKERRLVKAIEEVVVAAIDDDVSFLTLAVCVFKAYEIQSKGD